jgi:hypothetical protein
VAHDRPSGFGLKVPLHYLLGKGTKREAEHKLALSSVSQTIEQTERERESKPERRKGNPKHDKVEGTWLQLFSAKHP